MPTDTMDSTKSALPTSTDNLIFPLASHNFSQTLISLKRSRLSIRNRLSSIIADSQFVQRVAKCNTLPLVANERCGSWYIPPEMKVGSVYFKSTDGHSGQWCFSTRRLNLQLLELLGKYHGYDAATSGNQEPITDCMQLYHRRLYEERQDGARCSFQNSPNMVCCNE